MKTCNSCSVTSLYKYLPVSFKSLVEVQRKNTASAVYIKYQEISPASRLDHNYIDNTEKISISLSDNIGLYLFEHVPNYPNCLNINLQSNTIKLRKCCNIFCSTISPCVSTWTLSIVWLIYRYQSAFIGSSQQVLNTLIDHLIGKVFVFFCQTRTIIISKA